MILSSCIRFVLSLRAYDPTVAALRFKVATSFLVGKKLEDCNHYLYKIRLSFVSVVS